MKNASTVRVSIPYPSSAPAGAALQLQNGRLKKPSFVFTFPFLNFVSPLHENERVLITFSLGLHEVLRSTADTIVVHLVA